MRGDGNGTQDMDEHASDTQRERMGWRRQTALHGQTDGACLGWRWHVEKGWVCQDSEGPGCVGGSQGACLEHVVRVVAMSVFSSLQCVRAWLRLWQSRHADMVHMKRAGAAGCIVGQECGRDTGF